MDYTSKDNQIALKKHTIEQTCIAIQELLNNSILDKSFLTKLRKYRQTIEKAENEILNLVQPPKKAKEPKQWFSIEESANKLFNWSDHKLFDYLIQKGWLRKSDYHNWYIPDDYPKKMNYLKSTETILHNGNSYSRILISDLGEDALKRLKKCT